MSKSKNKLNRYSNLIKYINNWPFYLWKKITGFGDYFEFDVKNFGKIKVLKNTLGPFRENFLDGIYLSKLPEKCFEKSDLTVIDVGANIGFFSLHFLSRFPGAKIFAFEPHPYCFMVLKQYTEEYPGLDLNIFQKAVGGSNSKITLNTSKLDGFATMSSIYENENKGQKFETESITLERFLKNNKIDFIDLLKLDCEGSEYPIIYGLSEEVTKKIGAFAIETHQSERENENTLQLAAHLKSKGFEVKCMDEKKTGYIWAWKSNI